MKKFLIFSIIFVATIISFAFISNTFAADFGSYSADVTVGEVDKIDTKEDEDIDAPQTGIFGLSFENDLVATSMVLMAPITVFLVFLLRYCFLRTKYQTN